MTKKNPKRLLADELKVSLKLLLATLEEGGRVSIHGSPTASILSIVTDLLSVASSQVRRHQKWQKLANPDLRFVEQIKLTEEEASENPFGFLDPLLGREPDPQIGVPGSIVDPQYYESTFDPLGNPLQVSLSFDNTIPSLSDENRRTIAQSLEDIEHFLTQLSQGLLDWRFMRHLRTFVRGFTSTKASKKENMKFYHKRKRGRK